MNEESCASCRFLGFDSKCQRFPPQVIWVGGSDGAVGVFSPLVSEGGWCGEWKGFGYVAVSDSGAIDKRAALIMELVGGKDFNVLSCSASNKVHDAWNQNRNANELASWGYLKWQEWPYVGPTIAKQILDWLDTAALLPLA